MAGPLKQPWTFKGGKLEEIIASNDSHGPVMVTLCTVNDGIKVAIAFN